MGRFSLACCDTTDTAGINFATVSLLPGDSLKTVADRINGIVEKLGLTKFSEAPVPFNPEIHEALTHESSKDVTEPTASKILQPGYKFKDRVIRPARVAVSDPEVSA